MISYMIDMPKIQAPFIRDEKTHLVTDQINPGLEWVFTDPNVIAVEKLDGTNVSVYIEKGELTGVRNRTNVIECGALSNNRFMHGLRATYEKGWMPVATGQHFGELMGPKIQTNALDLKEPLWYPFDYLKRAAIYTSFQKYEKNYTNFSKWFQNDLCSLLCKQRGVDKQPEGVVFHHPDGRMAKLRGDMFDWHKGSKHKE